MNFLICGLHSFQNISFRFALKLFKNANKSSRKKTVFEFNFTSSGIHVSREIVCSFTDLPWVMSPSLHFGRFEHFLFLKVENNTLFSFSSWKLRILCLYFSFLKLEKRMLNFSFSSSFSSTLWTFVSATRFFFGELGWSDTSLVDRVSPPDAWAECG